MNDETRNNARPNGKNDTERSTNSPVDELRDGQYKVSFWRNQGKDRDYISVKPAKTYTDKEGNPRDTQNFSVRDLLPLSKLCEQAYDQGRELEQQIRQERGSMQRDEHNGMQDQHDDGKRAYKQQRQAGREERGQRQSRYVRGQ